MQLYLRPQVPQVKDQALVKSDMPPPKLRPQSEDEALVKLKMPPETLFCSFGAYLAKDILLELGLFPPQSG